LTEASTHAWPNDSFNSAAGYPTSGFFHKIAVPMVRRTYPELVAHDLVGVQPLTGPVGLAFALRFRAGNTVGSYVNAQDNPLNDTELGYNTIEQGFAGTGTGTTATGMTTSAGEVLGSSSTTGLGVGAGTNIREVNMTVEKAQIEATTRKLRSRWSLEIAQDLKAMHGLNIEEEMMDILAYEITAEIDRELIEKIDAVCVDGGANYSMTWNYQSVSGSTIGGRWEMERYRELYHFILRRAQAIAINTRRGSGNWLVGNPYSISIFESLASFSIAPVTGNAVDTLAVGVSRIGSLDGRISIYRDTFQDKNQFIVGYKGPSEYDTGVVYLPYIQLLASRATFEDSFHPTVGLMSRYAIHEHLFGAKNYYQKVTLLELPQ
jgi:hypothetical protein